MMIEKTGPFLQRHRLKNYEEFQAVFQNGRFFYNEVLKIGFLKNENKDSRLGIIVSKQHGNAPHRNKIKRLLREVFRQKRSEVLLPGDVLIIPRFTVKEWSLEICENAFKLLVKKYNDSLGIHKVH